MKKTLLALVVTAPILLLAQQGKQLAFKSKDGAFVVTGWSSWNAGRDDDHVVFVGKGSPLFFDIKKDKVTIKARQAEGVLNEVGKALEFDHGTLKGGVVLIQTAEGESRTMNSESVAIKKSGETWTVTSPGAAQASLSGKATTKLSASTLSCVFKPNNETDYRLSGNVRLATDTDTGTTTLTCGTLEGDGHKDSTDVRLSGHPVLTNKDTASGNVIILSGVRGQVVLNQKKDEFPLSKATFTGGVVVTLDGKNKKGGATNMKLTADSLTYSEATHRLVASGNVKVSGDDSLTYGTSEADEVEVEFTTDHKAKSVEFRAKEGRSTLKERKEEKP